MKIQIKATDVLDATEYWFRWLEEWVEEEYENDVKESMKRSWSNLWLGRSERFAIWWLENIRVGSLWSCYKDRLKDTFWRTTYNARTANKMAKIAIDSGQEYVWVDEDDLIYLNNYNTHQILKRKGLIENETKIS